MSLAIANRYARALADVVLDPKSGVAPETVLSDLRAVRQMMADSPELKSVLLSPAVPNPKKRAVINRLGDDAGLSRLVRNLLFVVIDKRRVHQIPTIVDAFEVAVDERMGRVRAHVASAAPLNPEQQAALEAQLAKLTGKQVRCEFHVEPDLIGGVTARIGSTVYDGSVRGQLDALRHRLTPA